MIFNIGKDFKWRLLELSLEEVVNYMLNNKSMDI